jgi:hypothetical protein
MNRVAPSRPRIVGRSVAGIAGRPPRGTGLLALAACTLVLVLLYLQGRVPEALDRVRQSILSSATLDTAIGLVGILGSLVGVAAWWHGYRRRTATADQRMVMLKRVRNYWIDAVLQPSLHPIGNLRLDFVSRPDLAACTPMTRGRRREPERLQGSIVDAFDQAAGGLLVLGGPGSGKTTLLLELARDLLDRAEDDPAYPIPVVSICRPGLDVKGSTTGWWRDFVLIMRSRSLSAGAGLKIASSCRCSTASMR